MNESLEYVKMFAQFPFALGKFLSEPMTPERAREIVRERMEERENNFLKMVEHCIYAQPSSPYLKLLKLAGCELSDLRALVHQKGLEPTLHELRDAGVYVTFEQAKGRKPIVRNGLTLNVTAHDFDNPMMRYGWQTETGGSTGKSTHVRQDLAHTSDRTATELITLDAYRLLGVPTVLYGNMLPAGAMIRVFQLALLNQSPQRWFVQNGWRDAKGWVKYDAAMLYMLTWLRLFGKKAPLPQTVRSTRALVVAQCIHGLLQHNPKCLVYAGISPATRVCVAAYEAGLDLTGTVFRGGGEPITPAKIHAIEHAGARYIPNYAMREGGYVAAGCANATDPSDVHLLRDLFALITVPHTVEGFDVTVSAFNFTSLLVTTPKVMLNLQVDDYGIVEERACGCELEAYGFKTHLRQIHSYSKFVGEGVTVIGSEMLRLLEQVLPAQFGGTPLDYQLIEEEDARGLSRLYLLISPRLHIADEQQVIQTFLAAMRDASVSADVASTIWHQADTVRIRRQEPLPSARGKMIPRRIRTNHQVR